MNIKCEQLFSNASPKTKLGKIIQFPLIRIIVVTLFIMPVTLLHLFTENIPNAFSEPYSTLLRYIETILMFALFLLAYRLYTKYVEKRKALEITQKNSFKELGSGFLVGTGLITTMVLILSVLGYYKIGSFNSNWMVITDSIFLFGMGAFAEELLYRLIIFKLSEELLGTWIAVSIQVILFGFAHLGNQNATIWTSLVVMVEAGILLTAAYMYTRRVWLVLGIHMSWNYFQAGIFGLPNSGKSYDSLINPAISGPEWITGGSFGIEASYVAMLMSLAVGLFILKKAIHKGQVVLPVWKRIQAK